MSCTLKCEVWDCEEHSAVSNSNSCLKCKSYPHWSWYKRWEAMNLGFQQIFERFKFKGRSSGYQLVNMQVFHGRRINEKQRKRKRKGKKRRREGRGGKKWREKRKEKESMKGKGKEKGRKCQGKGGNRKGKEKRKEMKGRKEKKWKERFGRNDSKYGREVQASQQSWMPCHPVLEFLQSNNSLT